MANKEKFEDMLSGGHPNSLGRTNEVVDVVVANKRRLAELYRCYFSKDEVVRLRTSSAMKRISIKKREWLIPYIDRLINDISKINQASTQWTLAILFDKLDQNMNSDQLKAAKKILKHNVKHHDDWIVLNYTMRTLTKWAKKDTRLKTWLMPHLNRIQTDNRKSVAATAKKMVATLS